MNINSVKDYYRYRVTTEGVKKPTGETKHAKDGGTASAVTDSVSISSQGSLRTQLLSEVRDTAAEFNSTISEDKLAELRQKYADNLCPITSMSLAESIITNVLGVGK